MPGSQSPLLGGSSRPGWLKEVKVWVPWNFQGWPFHCSFHHHHFLIYSRGHRDYLFLYLLEKLEGGDWRPSLCLCLCFVMRVGIWRAVAGEGGRRGKESKGEDCSWIQVDGKKRERGQAETGFSPPVQVPFPRHCSSVPGSLLLLLAKFYTL